MSQSDSQLALQRAIGLMTVIMESILLVLSYMDNFFIGNLNTMLIAIDNELIYIPTIIIAVAVDNLYCYILHSK